MMAQDHQQRNAREKPLGNHVHTVESTVARYNSRNAYMKRMGEKNSKKITTPRVSSSM